MGRNLKEKILYILFSVCRNKYQTNNFKYYGKASWLTWGRLIHLFFYYIVQTSNAEPEPHQNVYFFIQTVGKVVGAWAASFFLARSRSRINMMRLVNTGTNWLRIGKCVVHLEIVYIFAFMKFSLSYFCIQIFINPSKVGFCWPQLRMTYKIISQVNPT
jgi:hypothetical protein